MPIKHIPVNRIDQSAFREIDYTVMGLAYETHNTVGRHFDEAIFKNCLFEKMSKCCLEVEIESPICLIHKNFEKTFYVDLLVNRSVPYEFKATNVFHPKHAAQLLQYLHLLDLSHGKLINSRTKSVEGRFVSTQFNKTSRKQFSINDRDTDRSAESIDILQSLHELLSDWGTALETSTYDDALTYVLPNARKGRAEIHFNNKKVGSVDLTLVSPCSSLILTAFSKDMHAYRKHLTNVCL